MSRPHYPDLHLRLSGTNPLVWISEMRHALRRVGACREEIQRFSAAALAAPQVDDVRAVCSAWVHLEHS